MYTTGQVVLVSTLLARRRTKRLASSWHTLKGCSNFASAEPKGDNADVGLWPRPGPPEMSAFAPLLGDKADINFEFELPRITAIEATHRARAPTVRSWEDAPFW